MNSGTSHWEALCECQPIIRAQNAGVRRRIRQKVEQVAQQYARQILQIPIAFRVIAGLR